MNRQSASTGRAGIALAVEAPDSADARACRAAYFDELGRRFAEGFDAEADKTARDEDMRPPAGIFLLAWRDGEPVGCGGFCRLDPDIAEVKRMWTAPQARGAGVARRILRELERLAGEAGYSAIRLDTNRALGAAIEFYRRDGYGEIACYNENPYADHWFEKRL